MILPGTRRALELLVQADGELVLLGPGWHQRAVRSGRQRVMGPCWVPPERGAGREPRAIEVPLPSDVDSLLLNGWAVVPSPGRLLVTEAGRQAAKPATTLDDLECERCGGWIGVPGGCVCEVAEKVDHG